MTFPDPDLDTYWEVIILLLFYYLLFFQNIHQILLLFYKQSRHFHLSFSLVSVEGVPIDDVIYA